MDFSEKIRNGGSMLFAVMDLGSNSFKMTIARWSTELHAEGRAFEVLHKERHPIQLGGSVFTSGVISPEDEKLAFRALEKMQLRLRDYSSPILRVVGTSALREAKNAKSFLERVKKELGLNIEIISGSEEARFIAEGLNWEHPRVLRGLLIDIGGGSTEVAGFGKAWKETYGISMRLGSVRMAVPYLNESLKSFDVNKCRNDVRKRLGTLAPPEMKLDLVIGSAGAIESLSKILGQGKPLKIDVSTLDAWIEASHLLSFKELENKFKLSDSRARIVIPGAVILSEILVWLKQKSLQVTEMTLRDGLLVDLVHRWQPDSLPLPASESDENPMGPTLIDREAKRWIEEFEQVALRFHCNLAHSYHVAKLALNLLRHLKKAGFVFEDNDKKLLLAACYLHDVGLSISRNAHHRHSAYILKNISFQCLSVEESQILASICHYHRKNSPENKDPLEGDLKNVRANCVRRLSALLRMADGLDKDHSQNIRHLEIKVRDKELVMEISLNRAENFSPEYFNSKAEYFEQYFGLKTVIYINSKRASEN